MKENIIKFIKSKDFVLLEELGRGACGKTVKLFDDVINETFVCKKYEPFYEEHKEILFDNFIQEIKLLYLLNHKNVVRIFNYYIYPKKQTGYILMEYIEGNDIESYLIDNPQNINNIFNQCVSGFLHLEKCKILHRDIRPLNILVSNDNELKIIDFGFGKKASSNSDFDKSISLNWWCEPPIDFKNKQYDFNTEVYFVGKLFEKIIKDRDISTFKYSALLSKMCDPDPITRIPSFSDVSNALSENRFLEIEFNYFEQKTYREFSTSLTSAISKIEIDCKYYEDSELIQQKLDDCYRKTMLEELVPSNPIITKCFLNGSFYFTKKIFFPVSEIKAFIELIRSCSQDKKNIIFENLFLKLDSIERYSESPVEFDDDIPF